LHLAGVFHRRRGSARPLSGAEVKANKHLASGIREPAEHRDHAWVVGGHLSPLFGLFVKVADSGDYWRGLWHGASVPGGVVFWQASRANRSKRS